MEHWSFSGGAGDFLDVARHGVARQACLQGTDDLLSNALGDFEVLSSGDTIQLMQIVRHNSGIHETQAELFLSVCSVVDIPKEDGLVQHGKSRSNQLLQCRQTVVPDLGRMIGMNDHKDLQWQAGQQRAEFGCDASWQYDGKTGVDSESCDVRDPADALAQLCQSMIVKHEGIATTEDDFVDFRAAFNFRHGWFPVFQPTGFFGIRVLATKAVAAVHGTGSGCH